ncbi:A24 family peptidase [Streptomyces sp. CA-210063]|uniref:prepilin peptidase n=1 Tax=Streptomyces sp. CA-210063 TaxID=2801029 RepID=UPI00214BA704|nr:A24 family peptidase [Streptomyces sp. CA-210063]UUU28445.1 A24 family peptidase [Streptomyces sp. CA-210063]UUU36828.1 A24 family peptidase [Streptomyces sp. CA-210063]
METFWITAAAVLWGVGTGLLIPRAAYRLSVPPGEPWRAVCPAGHPVAGAGNGWLGRARCADGDSYGPSMPVLATVSAAACAVLAAATGVRPELVVWLLLAPAGVLLAIVDARAHRLPDVLTLPLAVAVLVLLGVVALLPGADGSWKTALLGSVALGAGFFAMFLIAPRGLGFGDVKLALALGAVLGWRGWGILLAGTFAGYLLFSLYGIGLILTRRSSRTKAIPVGPFVLAGTLVGTLLGSCAQ